MKKLVYLLVLSVGFSFAQTTTKEKVKFSAKIENRNSDTLTVFGPNKFNMSNKISRPGLAI